MQNPKDYYESLDVEKESSADDIKKSYLLLALKWHPDKNRIGKKRAIEVFKEISEAYIILSDSSLRSIYDTEGSDSAKSHCTTYDLSSFSLENALELFSSLYNGRDPVSACIHDDNWYENCELFNGGLIKHKPFDRNWGKNEIETEFIETTMSKYTTSPRGIEKSVKTITVERDGRRVKKTITTVIRPDGSQEIIEEEKEEPLRSNVIRV